MKVLLTAPDLDVVSGGPPAVVAGVATALALQGHSVALVYTENSERARIALPEGLFCIPIARHRNNFLRLCRYYEVASKTIYEWGPDVVHDHGLWLPENAAAMFAARRANCPLISQPCGMLQQWPMKQQRFKKMLAWHGYQHRLLGHASAVILTSHREKIEADSRLRRKGLTHHIPHGVDLPPSIPRLIRRRQAVFMGRLHPVKQVDALLHAWALLKPAGWRFVIAGSGDPDYERYLHELARHLEVADSVEFAGLVQGHAKTNLLAESQLFLQPSLQENFGLAVAEAMAHGLPVLTTQAMPWEEVVAANCGWSVAANADAIRAALAEALALPAEELLAMGKRAQQLSASYSWEKSAQQLVEIYQHVLN